MNWFDLAEESGGEVLFTKTIRLSCASKPKIKKTSGYYGSKNHDIDFSVYENNDGYNGKVSITENKNKIVINARILNSVYHFPLLEEKWHYGHDEKIRALRTYNRIINVLEDAKVDAETDELPGPSLQGLIREELRYIDIDRKKGTRNRSLEAAKYLSGEEDWRSSIYGNRYPTPPISITNHGDIYL